MNFQEETHQAMISGIGVISPIGNDIESVRQNLHKGADGIAQASKIDVSAFPSKLCAQYDFDYSTQMTSAELDLFTDPFMRLAISCARLALKDSGIDLSKNKKRIALVFATCNAGMTSSEAEYKIKFGCKNTQFNRATLFQRDFYSPAKALTCALGLEGEVWIVNTACSGSTAAIGLAETLIESGKADAVLVGGADAMALSNYAGFSAIKVISPEKIAPFSEPVGMNIGEGAAFWVLENLNSAVKRNAKIYAKVIGHATTGDAYHPTQPDPRGDGAYRTMRNALKNANIELSQIACINAHASGTNANDKAEAKGILKFSDGQKIPLTSTKSYMGHCMGATGILEATSQLIGMLDNFIPPTLHFTQIRKECENIDLVANTPRELNYDCFLSANYAFAGNNAAVIIAKPEFKSAKIKPAKKSLAITSHCAFTPLAKDTPELLQALREGKSSIAKVERYADLPENFSYASLMPKFSLRELDRHIDYTGMSQIGIYASCATKKAIDKARLKITKELAEDVSLTFSISRGADDSAHLNGVFSSPEHKGNIACFSNVTANSTAGWVSKSLNIKGSNITLTSGLNSSLQSIMYACQILQANEAKYALACAADEVPAQQLRAYAQLGLLCDNAQAADFKIRKENDFQTCLGEGAVAFFIEEKENAIERGAKILGEIAGYAIGVFASDFLGCEFSESTMDATISQALLEANLSADDIDLIVWSPSGTSQDEALSNFCKTRLKNAKMLTSVFNTGYIETSSAAISLAATLEALQNGNEFWPQRTGDEFADKSSAPVKAKNILALSASHVGNYYSLVIKFADSNLNDEI